MLSGDIIIALKDALAVIYWTKRDLRLFINSALIHKELVGCADWTETKYEICSQLINYMVEHQSYYGDDIYSLIKNTCQMDDFSHLMRWENGKELVAKAKKSVTTLQNVCNSHRVDFEDRLQIKEKRKKAQERIQKTEDYRRKLSELQTSFYGLTKLPPQEKGYKFEKFLVDLFSFFDLAPRGAFKIVGEQIDGAFTHDGTDYLLEAKYQEKPIANGDLYAFAGKINSKLKSTLGLFISISGFSSEALETRGATNNAIILIDGRDLVSVLENRIDLSDMIRIKRRHAAETGEIMYRID